MICFRKKSQNSQVGNKNIQRLLHYRNIVNPDNQIVDILNYQFWYCKDQIDLNNQGLTVLAAAAYNKNLESNTVIKKNKFYH